MTEEKDRDSKTEDPTEKRITDAIEKGNVPLAREATLFGSITSIFIVLALLGSWTVAGLTESLQVAFANAGTLHIGDREATATYLVPLLQSMSLQILPVMAIIAAGSIIGSLLQNVPSATAERITPKVVRTSITSGWSRLFGHKGFAEFGKSILKLAAVTAILWLQFRIDLEHFVSSLTSDPALLPTLLRDLATAALIPLMVLALLLGIGDLILSRLHWRRDLRMTRQEVKDEMKESEGDPLLKAHIRGLARQRNSHRMLESLPQASMVITNPTHYAVALRYQRGDGGAPVVVAKGVDHMAQKIREIATLHEVPLVENRPLARSLYDQVDIDTQIPPDFYRAVAEIIHYLNNTGRLPGHARPR